MQCPVMLSINEKTQIETLGQTHKSLPMKLERLIAIRQKDDNA